MTNFQKALKQYPVDGLDLIGQHHTISDLVYSVNIALDLYEDQPECCGIRNKRHAARCKAFVDRWKGISETDALGR